MINPKTRKVEIRTQNSVSDLDQIMDFKLFGEQEGRVIALTMDRYVLLYDLGSNQKRGIVAHYQEERKRYMTEIASSIAVCDKNEYVFLEIGLLTSSLGLLCSRMIILKLTQNTFSKIG